MRCGAISTTGEQSCRAFERSKEKNIVEVELKYSLSRPELEGDEVLAPPPVGGLEPSDCHLAVFLDDIGKIEILLALLGDLENILGVSMVLLNKRGAAEESVHRSFSKVAGHRFHTKNLAGPLLGRYSGEESELDDY